MNRRCFLLSFLMAAGLAAAPAPLVRGVDSIGITVAHLDQSMDFYTQVLTFTKVSEGESHGEATERLYGVFGARVRWVRLQLGDEFIELREFLTPRGRPHPPDSRANDRWFQHIAIIVSDMDRAYHHLRQHRVEHASPAPQLLPAWNPNAGGIRAFYFRDPDGHALELLQFPPGKGLPKWQAAQGRLFLGIDHTAIVVSDTAQSLRFYRDVLGLTVTGSSENYGPEQERLNNVFGAHLRITALRGSTGPGIEFLEYLSPGDGRPYPPDARPNDLLHWQTRFIGVSAAEAITRFRAMRATFLSVPRPDGAAAHPKSASVRDPDGHAIEVAEAQGH
jgi:catechol 2,3-dioxygenase-like lactoylglutathione lyase family enzyme